MPEVGEGETKATQIVTCVNKLVYKWYNDGDVFDNTHFLDNGANDLSDYANWLYQNTNVEVQNILDNIVSCMFDGEYEELLKKLTDQLLEEEYLYIQNKFDKVGTIYDCNGKFKYVESYDDEDDYYDEDDDWDEDEDEDEDDE